METAPSAASRFAGTLVVLRSLGEQIRSLKTLHSLCLTSKPFNAEFSFHLYRDLDTRIDLIDEHNPHLVHTRSLLARKTWGKDDDEFNEVVQRLVASMPFLETFVWPPSVGLVQATVDALRTACNRLRAVHIHTLHYDKDVDMRPEIVIGVNIGLGSYFKHDLSTFMNLQYLSLTRLNADLLKWKDQIVQILLNSPTLKGLNISLAATALYRYAHAENAEAYEDFFDSLCDDYAAAGGQPLHFRSLTCGQAIYPTSPISLAKLTTLESLEEVDICNLAVHWHTELTVLYDYDPDQSDERTEQDECGIVFDQFTPSNCPNLHRFAAADYRPDVHRLMGAFAQDRSFSRRLIVEFGNTACSDTARMLRPDPDYPALPIQVRMLLGLQLDRSRVGARSVAEEDSTKFSAEQVLDHLISSNADTLEGLLVNVAQRSLWQVSDLSDFHFQDLDAVEAALPRLPRLTQLAVNTDRLLPGIPEGSVLPENVLLAAKRLALAGPYLAYVNIYAQFWRVLRRVDGTVELEEMEEREWKGVELFYHAAWTPDRYYFSGY